MKRIAFAAALCLIGVAAPAARAATCGDKDPTTGKNVRASMTLDEKSRTNLPFKRNKKRQPYTFIFTLSGCDMPDTPALPRLVIVPTKGDDIADALEHQPLTDNDVNFNGNTLIVKAPVDPTKIGAGTDTGYAILQAPYLTENRTPITFSRSETKWPLVLLLGFVAAAIGLGWLFVQNLDAVGASIRGKKLWAVSVAAICAGLIVTLKDYLGQEVWTFGDNGWSLAAAAFLAASAGSVAALIGASSK